MDTDTILKNLKEMIKEPKCELNYNTDWQLLFAIILSAQCTDKKVNAITPILFKKYPTLNDLQNASYEDVKQIIFPLGLSATKAKSIIEIAKILIQKHNSKVPNNKEDLLLLPSVGEKTANVMLIEYFNIPAFPVDTHVTRVSKRLGLCNEKDSFKQIEMKLTQIFPQEEWALLHLRMVLFGRYTCKAIKPECSSCLFKGKCNYNKN